MDALVVYYSRTGTTRKAARAVAYELGGEVEVLDDMRDRSGVLGYLRSGWEALTKKTVELRELEHDPSDFDLVVIGTPVWAQGPSSPVRTYMEKYCAGSDRVAYLCTMGGTGAKKTFKKMEAICGEPVAVLSLSHGEVEKGEHEDKVKGFVEDL